MTGTFTRRRGIPKLALLTVLATVAIGFAAITTIAASAASAGANNADGGLSTSGTAMRASSTELPTLTNDVGPPSGGAERQLALGIALLALGMVGVLFGVLALRATARRPTPCATHQVVSQANVPQYWSEAGGGCAGRE